MKKIIYILILLLLIIPQLYGQETDQLKYLFNQEWKYDPKTIDLASQNAYEKFLASVRNKKEIKDYQKNKELIIRSFKEILPSVTITYKKNQEISITVNRETFKENWTYNSVTKTISYTDSSTKTKNDQTILELTSSIFKFKDQFGYETILIPAKDIKQPTLDYEAIKKDLDIYRNIVETAHSGMNLYTSKKTFATLFEEAYKQIPSLKNTREFYKLLATIHTQINCGHSSFHTTDNIYSEIKSNTKKSFFPFKIKFLKDTLVIAQDYEKIKRGTQIISINRNSVEKITQETFKLISSDGYNTTFKYRQLENDFSTNYFLVYGQQEEFTIEYISNSGKLQTINIPGIAITELEETITEETYDNPYYLNYLDQNTALLTVNTFSTETPQNQKRFFKFLRNSFQEINKKRIKNLILDIRENTGGDDGNDMELASYFINKHFKENKYRKLNTLDNLPPFPEYLLSQWYDMLDMDSDSSPEEIQKITRKEILKQMYKGDDGSYYWKDDAVIHRDPAKNKFTGNVYILTSGKVFSGGALFSALVRDKSNAIFIGEETGGGYYRHTGTIPLFYSLPNSGLIFSIFIVINEQDVDQNLFPEGSGTRPHHIVYPTKQEFIKGTDVVLEKAKQLIQSNK